MHQFMTNQGFVVAGFGPDEDKGPAAKSVEAFGDQGGADNHSVTPVLFAT